MPSIQELFIAMWLFGVRNQKAGINRKQWEESREQLKKDLERLGVADKFDWTLDE